MSLELIIVLSTVAVIAVAGIKVAFLLKLTRKKDPEDTDDSDA